MWNEKNESLFTGFFYYLRLFVQYFFFFQFFKQLNANHSSACGEPCYNIQYLYITPGVYFIAPTVENNDQEGTEKKIEHSPCANEAMRCIPFAI